MSQSAPIGASDFKWWFCVRLDRQHTAWLVAVIASYLVFAPLAAAKMPGQVHCYKDVCHRVKTIEETEALVGKRLDIKTSHYDSPERDPYNIGKYTSSGEEFDAENASRAASAHFPDGTELLVWNPRNGRASHLRVNDFGPFHTDRTLDVTRSAAEKLGFSQQGVVTLQVYVIAGPDSDWPRYELARSYPRTEGFLGIIPRNQLIEVVHDLAERVRRTRNALKPIPPEQPAPIPPPMLSLARVKVPYVSQAHMSIQNMPTAKALLRDARVDDEMLMRQPSVGTTARAYLISVDAKPGWVRTRISPSVLSAAVSAGLDLAYAPATRPRLVALADSAVSNLEILSRRVDLVQSGAWSGSVARPAAAEATAYHAHAPINSNVVKPLARGQLSIESNVSDYGVQEQVAAVDQLKRQRVATLYGRDLTVEFPRRLGPTPFQLSIPAIMILLTILTWLLVGRRDELARAHVELNPIGPLPARDDARQDRWPTHSILKHGKNLIEMAQPPPLPKQYQETHKAVDASTGEQLMVSELEKDPVARGQSETSGTVIGAGATLVGEINSASEVVISGRFEGPCTARHLEVAEGGMVKGRVDADDLVVGGDLSANVQTGYVHVTRTGKVDGDVNYGQLSVETGGVLAARCQRICEKDTDEQLLVNAPEVSSP